MKISSLGGFVKHWNRQPREVLASQSLEVPKNCTAVVPGDMAVLGWCLDSEVFFSTLIIL